MVVQKASRVLRKSARQMKTRIRPRRALRSSRPMRCLRMIESSSQVSTETPAGRLGARSCEVVLGGPRHLERTLVADPEDLDQGRALAVESGRGVGVLEPVDRRWPHRESSTWVPSGRVTTTMSSNSAPR